MTGRPAVQTTDGSELIVGKFPQTQHVEYELGLHGKVAVELS